MRHQASSTSIIGLTGCNPEWKCSQSSSGRSPRTSNPSTTLSTTETDTHAMRKPKTSEAVWRIKAQIMQPVDGVEIDKSTPK